MPTTRRRKAKPRRGRRRRGWNRPKRRQQNLTRDTRWFKEVRLIQSNDSGNFREIFQPQSVTNCADFLKWGALWEEYKCWKVVVKFFPAAVGSESLQEAPANIPGHLATFKRGDCITWIDQGFLDAPTSINNIIVKPSARLINPRFKHTRWFNRPPGNPEWGKLAVTGVPVDPDSWDDTRLQMYGQGFSPLTDPGSQTWFYCLVAYKVTFRGRDQQV